MALQYTYPDEYLAKRITEDRETRAINEASLTGITDTAYLEKLSILKCYIITSLECNSKPDDVFAQKLKIYSKEYDALLSTALETQREVSGKSLYSIEIGRA